MPVKQFDQPVTGVRQRTRRAILDAALALWARDFSASLGEIAQRAEVSRSTLHRYFPDRQTLIDAALVDAIETLDRVSEQATSSCATAGEEVEAMMRTLIDNGDLILFLFSDMERFKGNPHWVENDEDEKELADLFIRAQREGVLASDVDPAWMVAVFYSLIFAAAASISAGRLPPHRAADLALRTFRHGLGQTL